MGSVWVPGCYLSDKSFAVISLLLPLARADSKKSLTPGRRSSSPPRKNAAATINAGARTPNRRTGPCRPEREMVQRGQALRLHQAGGRFERCLRAHLSSTRLRYEPRQDSTAPPQLHSVGLRQLFRGEAFYKFPEMSPTPPVLIRRIVHGVQAVSYHSYRGTRICIGCQGRREARPKGGAKYCHHGRGVRWSEEVGVRLGAAGAGNAGRA